jgi:hypothetical protein
MLRADAVMYADQPRLEISKDEMNDGQELEVDPIRWTGIQMSHSKRESRRVQVPLPVRGGNDVIALFPIRGGLHQIDVRVAHQTETAKRPVMSPTAPVARCGR